MEAINGPLMLLKNTAYGRNCGRIVKGNKKSTKKKFLFSIQTYFYVLNKLSIEIDN